MRLLIAEDDVRLLRSLSHILQRERYLVDGVDNGEEALLWSETGEYDGLVLDIMMPGMDGVTVLKRLRQKGVDTPALFLTAAWVVFGAGSLAALLLVVLFSKRAVGPVAESHQRQRQFVTDASHELKTPLTLLQTNLDILEGDVGENPWLSDMKEETATMSRLVRQLVDLARLDEEAPPVREPYDLAQAVWDTASSFLPLAESRGKALTFSGPASLWWKGDEAGIRQLTSILLDNAVKYCDPGGSIQVTLEEKRRPVLLVDNDCQAVEELPLSQLFHRFYRGDPARTYGSGFGVGLSIAQGIVQRQGGAISAQMPRPGLIRFRVKF